MKQSSTYIQYLQGCDVELLFSFRLSQIGRAALSTAESLRIVGTFRQTEAPRSTPRAAAEEVFDGDRGCRGVTNVDGLTNVGDRGCRGLTNVGATGDSYVVCGDVPAQFRF